MSVLERQLALEEEYTTASLVAGQEQVLDAFRQGRATDVGSGRILLAKSYELGLQEFQKLLAKPSRGLNGKYRTLLQIAEPEVLVMATLRELLNRCAHPEPQPMQTVLRKVGQVVESESMLACMSKVSSVYTDRTVEYLDTAGTRSVSHRYRTFLAGATNLGMQWEQWSYAERTGVARLILTCLYDATGLFKWVQPTKSMYYIQPSDDLAKHFSDVQSAAKALVKYPPMLLPPRKWKGQYEGGYLTEWFQHHSPMCGVRYIKREQKAWVLEHLNSPQSAPVRSAMDKAQEVPYRVNKATLSILRAATATRRGILGLPSFVPAKEPVFPLGANWQKDEATDLELERFQFWKTQMAAWYTSEAKRKGRHVGILGKIRELVKYQDEEALYFPTFIDWRGRLYFRSSLHPQTSDAIKGCLEFAEGKRLGVDGLFWLKVHVANCCGYDKHDPTIKAQYVDDNWLIIQDFINNPLEVDAPDPDTAFTLLQAGLALQEALDLPDPTEYTCHVPVAMDASCSGLQHLSALTRDTTGAFYTNLVDNGSDQKSDIYVRVAEVADELKSSLCTRKLKTEEGTKTIHDSVLEHYWKDKPISRKLAKSPVMTFVYGSTLITTIEGIALEMESAGMPDILDEEGKLLYSRNALATPVGKALREGVVSTVPEAAKMMKYLQNIVRKHPEKCLRWLTPLGVPVVNWAEGSVSKRIIIRSMGVSAITFSTDTGEYNTRIAANGIVPNFVHSMDGTHLCMTLLGFNGNILPIHDSLATHPSDVSTMHEVLRETFVELYSNLTIEKFLEDNGINIEDYTPPEQGTLTLEDVLESRFMFG
ncbi:DNA directed RNA polymerase [Vibrio phage vB_VhaP_VH-5]|uniref:DNA-directed RNA polymerase n=1 Tax=Vibrio phage vB_VhaP_VH-5 TaxID=2660694 RepID=A0A5Q2W937_9CAUD|nr:DNA directed RNA polymerase [Vibrio phage vB_VhaP_VH-5]